MDSRFFPPNLIVYYLDNSVKQSTFMPYLGGDSARYLRNSYAVIHCETDVTDGITKGVCRILCTNTRKFTMVRIGIF